MKFRYLPTTEQDRQEMLQTIGVSSIEELFAEIPKEVRFPGQYQIPEALAEPTLVRHMQKLAGQNFSTEEYISFLGAGVYEHYIPSVVHHMISRSEFYTAYTPYQPEISQGELQAIFEFQTMICELTGREVSNSSMYDGSTALAEAANLAVGHTRKRKVVVSAAVHPEAREILQTNSYGLGYEVVEVPIKDGITDLGRLEAAADADTAAVIVQSPNFFGNLEPLGQIELIAHRGKGLLVVSSNPLSVFTTMGFGR